MESTISLQTKKVKAYLWEPLKKQKRAYFIIPIPGQVCKIIQITVVVAAAANSYDMLQNAVCEPDYYKFIKMHSKRYE
jgi:hypothetical protein